MNSMNRRILPTLIIALGGAVIGSFLMMLYASSHFTGVAGPNHTPPVVSAAPLTGISDQDRIVSAVARTKPSVVAIQIIQNGQVVVPVDPFLSQVFGQSGPGVLRKYKQRSSGSGFILDSQGDIVTNAHVVVPNSNTTSEQINVVFADGHKSLAKIVSASVGNDIAIIKVDNTKNLPPPLKLANSDKLLQGMWAIAIGEPLGYQQTVTLGIISGFNRGEQIQSEQGQLLDFKGLLQTSAPINPGNSGGPLIDIDGQVIGINQSTVKSAYAQGIGFAIPSNQVQTVVSDLLKHPGVHYSAGSGKGAVGVEPQDLTPGLRNQIGYSGTGGVAIVNVLPGTPADQAGIEPGDVVLEVDGKPMNSAKDFVDYISSKKPGDTVRMVVWSQGVKKFVAVKLVDRSSLNPAAAQRPQQYAPPQTP